MSRLILLRHGQSEWNKKNLFTGWVDIPLSFEGIKEAFAAGRELREEPIDLIFTSTLIRATMTAMLVMNVHSSGKIPVFTHQGEGQLEEWGQCHSPETAENLVPVFQSWHLNERMYGDLQGMNKQDMREKYGDEQVHLWRRSFDISPPHGESLKETAERTLPFFYQTIVPYLKAQKNILISAHGNSLRSIVMGLENLSSEQVLKLEIPTGKPLYYELEGEAFRRVK